MGRFNMPDDIMSRKTERLFGGSRLLLQPPTPVSRVNIVPCPASGNLSALMRQEFRPRDGLGSSTNSPLTGRRESFQFAAIERDKDSQKRSLTNSLVTKQKKDPEKLMRLKNDKNYSEPKLISDIIAQKTEVEELFAFLVLFQSVAKVDISLQTGIQRAERREGLH